jgi:hypothetical protein
MDEDKQSEGKKKRNSRTMTRLYRSKRRRPSTIVDRPPRRSPVHLLRGGEVGGGRDIAVEKFCPNMSLRSSADAAKSPIRPNG